MPDIKTLTTEEKLLTMRNLWEDMRQGFEESSESDEVCDLLDARVARVELGEAKLLDWDDVKGSIGHR
ncbi:addiction module protein [Lentimonas sp. CC10]|uniref:addiction module protein n=1 Tax=Lentimonas sp. CC10 TaxID=2676095 RepID=UPI0013897E5B|nr:addiction module protein [Lentimonas sp. CC10]